MFLGQLSTNILNIEEHSFTNSGIFHLIIYICLWRFPGLGRFTPVFSKEQEEELTDHVLFLQSRLYGLTRIEVRSLAYELAEKNNIEHNFSGEKAGRDWPHAFVKRSGRLSFRNYFGLTSAARAHRFTKESVAEFFDCWEEVQDECNLGPDRIWNVDEVGILTVPKFHAEILARKGQKQVGTLASAEKGQLVSVEMCVAADGQVMPPMFIYPGKKHVPQSSLGAPTGSI